MELVSVILTSLGVSGATAFALTNYLGGIWAKRIEIREEARLGFLSDIDQELRTARIAAYKLIWKSTGILPKWPTRVASFEELKALREELRRWYFEEGGLFLSEDTRSNEYETLQSNLCSVPDERKGTLSPEEYERYRELCSVFRSALVRDILSRRTLANQQA